MRENKLVDLLELFLHYQTDTEPGSSGSPVFNHQWEVVGLHHSGVPRKDETGALLAIDGSRWTPEMGEHRLAWIANEGVRISRVLRAIREQELTGAAADLRAQLFEATPVASSAGLPAAGGEASSAGSGFAQSAGEVAQFTLPLRITVGVELGTDRPPASAPTVGPPAAAPAAPGRDAILPADVDQAMLRSGLASLEANRDRPYYEKDADTSAQERYYEGLDSDADPEQLRRALGELLGRTHSPRPRYRPSDLVYPWVDLHPDRLLRSIYSGKAFEPEELIREDARVEAVRATLTALIKEGMKAGGPRVALERFIRFGAGDANWERLEPSTKEWMLASAATYFGVESGAFDAYLPDEERLAAIPVPIQLLVSTGSLPGFAQAAGRLAERLGVEITRTPGTHFPYLDHPRELAETVKPFLRGVSR